MQNTIKPLAELRDHWKAEGCPSIAKIAKAANIPNATANRYLTGITKSGEVETVRALAIAMGRQDIADSIPYTEVGGNKQTNDYIVELKRQWQEQLQQQLADVTTKHKQELEDLTRDHRAERDDWHKQRNAMYEEITSLRSSFDSLTKIQHREKWTAYALCIIAVAALLVIK